MNNEQVCGFCGNKTTINWVHGHGECSICHSNIDECCSGECEQGKNTIEKTLKKGETNDSRG